MRVFHIFRIQLYHIVIVDIGIMAISRRVHSGLTEGRDLYVIQMHRHNNSCLSKIRSSRSISHSRSDIINTAIVCCSH